jgi:hypothetical protein
MTAVLVLQHYVQCAHITIKTSLLNHRDNDIREIFVGAHVTEKKIARYCSLCSKWRLRKGVVKDVTSKRIGIARSSSVYKSSNKF